LLHVLFLFPHSGHAHPKRHLFEGPSASDPFYRPQVAAAVNANSLSTLQFITRSAGQVRSPFFSRFTPLRCAPRALCSKRQRFLSHAVPERNTLSLAAHRLPSVKMLFSFFFVPRRSQKVLLFLPAFVGQPTAPPPFEPVFLPTRCAFCVYFNGLRGKLHIYLEFALLALNVGDQPTVTRDVLHLFFMLIFLVATKCFCGRVLFRY